MNESDRISNDEENMGYAFNMYSISLQQSLILSFSFDLSPVGLVVLL